MFCREQVARLAGRLDEIRTLGAELYAIGNGAPHFASAFREEQRVDFPVLTDPELGAFAAFGMERNALGLLRPTVWMSAVRALTSGHRQSGVRGDPFQNGGVAVVRPGGELAYLHVESASGDLADLNDVVAALRQPGARGRA